MGPEGCGCEWTPPDVSVQGCSTTGAEPPTFLSCLFDHVPLDRCVIARSDRSEAHMSASRRPGKEAGPSVGEVLNFL